MTTPDTPPPASPLAEADPQSLEVLFSRDPFEMIAEDTAAEVAGKPARNFPTIVAELRRHLARYRADLLANDGTKKATRGPKPPKIKSNTSLDDLGLGE